MKPTTFDACDVDIYTLYTSLEVDPVPQASASQPVVAFLLYLDPPLAKPADQELLTKELADKMTFYLNYTDPNGNLEFVTYDQTITYVPPTQGLPPKIRVQLTVAASA